MTTRRLHLNAFLMSTGHHEASWRLPESDPYAHVDLRHYTRLAQTAERGTFDSLFLADSPQLWGELGQRPAGALEPLTLLTALATATEHIGLIATASTSYNSPTTWPADSPRWTSSAAAGRAGTSSPPRARRRPATSAWSRSPRTPNGTRGPPTSSMWH